MERIELEDFLKYHFISGLKLCNDNKKVLFVVSKSSDDKCSYNQNIYVYDGQIKQLTQSGNVNNYCIVDDETILFEEKSKDAYRHFNYLNLKTGIIKKAFDLPLLNAEIKMIDKNRIAILSIVKKDNPDLYISNDYEDQFDVFKETDYEILDENPYWFNGQGFTSGNRMALFLMDLDNPNSLKRISNPLLDIKKIEIKDGIIYALGDEFNSKANNYLKIYKIVDDKFEVLVTSDTIHFNNFIFKGDDLLVFGSDQEKWGINQNEDIYILKDNSLKLYYQNNESFGSSVGSDCRYGKTSYLQSYNNNIFYISTRFNGSYIFKLNDEVKEEKLSINIDGSIDDFVIGDEFVYYVGMLNNKLEEIYRINLKTKKEEQISFFNEEILKDKYVADYNEITCISHDTKIYGWVLKPKDFDPLKKYPAILDVHGGPKTVYGKVFYHEMQYWANQGFFVLFSNPIGGDGRGNEFMYMSGRYGSDDYDSLMEFVNTALKEFPNIDKENICETGGSYGGFMTNWIIGHTNRFKACASQRSISNWLSFLGTSDIGYMFVKDQLNVKEPLKNIDVLWDKSPLKYANNAKTPTLFIHSDEDYRCPIEQGLQMMSALIENGVDTRMCYFHKENHELSRGGKPKNRIKRLDEITKWFLKYIKEDMNV